MRHKWPILLFCAVLLFVTISQKTEKFYVASKEDFELSMSTSKLSVKQNEPINITATLQYKQNQRASISINSTSPSSKLITIYEDGNYIPEHSNESNLAIMEIRSKQAITESKEFVFLKKGEHRINTYVNLTIASSEKYSGNHTYKLENSLVIRVE